MKPVEHLAIAICDAFFETAGEAARWPTIPEYKRQTFRLCAQAAIDAGRTVAAGLNTASLEVVVALAICVAFFEDAGRAYRSWHNLSGTYRELFMILARAAIAAGRELREAQAGRGRGVVA